MNLTKIRVFTDMQAYTAHPQFPMDSYGVYRDAHRHAQRSFDAMRESGYPDCVVVAVIPSYGVVRWSANFPKGQEVKP